jgi:hypothetical protein
MLSRSYWEDTFTRLGPAEAYGIPAALLALVGFVAIFVGGDRRARFYLATAAGTLVAAGSKENLLILAIPLAVLAAKDWRVLPNILRALFSVALVLLAFDGFWVLSIVSRTSADMFGRSTSVGTRLALIASFLRRPEVRAAGCAALAIAAAVVWARRQAAPLGPIGRRLAILSVVLFGCVALAATQFVFYAGGLPSASRYDFPYVTGFDVALIVAMIVALRIADALLSRWRFGAVATGIAAVAASAVLLVAARPGLALMRGDVQRMRIANLTFADNFARAVEEFRRSGATCVLLQPHRGIDSELVVSTARHLVARGVSVPIYLIVGEGHGDSPNDWERGLYEAMQAWSSVGNDVIRPLPRDLGPCYGFGFHGSPPERCTAGVEVRQEGWSVAIGPNDPRSRP